MVRSIDDNTAGRKLDDELRDATRTGDAHDIRGGLQALHDEHYQAFDAAVENRLGSDDLVSSAEVIDEAMTRALNKLSDFNMLEERDEVPELLRRFMDGEITGLDLLLLYTGHRKRGVIGDLTRAVARHKALALKDASADLHSGAATDLHGRDDARYSNPKAEDVVDTKTRILALNAALRHLDPKERLALALTYDVAGAGSITDQRVDLSEREAQLFSLALTFDMQKAEAELLRYRFKEHIASTKALEAKSGGRSCRYAKGDGLQQQDIAALLGIDAPKASRLLSGAKRKLRLELAEIGIFAA